MDKYDLNGVLLSNRRCLPYWRSMLTGCRKLPSRQILRSFKRDPTYVTILAQLGSTNANRVNQTVGSRVEPSQYAHAAPRLNFWTRFSPLATPAEDLDKA